MARNTFPKLGRVPASGTSSADCAVFRHNRCLVDSLEDNHLDCLHRRNHHELDSAVHTEQIEVLVLFVRTSVPVGCGAHPAGSVDLVSGAHGGGDVSTVESQKG